MRKMYLHIKHNINGPTFRMLVNADEFVKDAKHVEEKQLPALEPLDHDDWYNTQHDFDQQNHIPETYK